MTEVTNWYLGWSPLFPELHSADDQSIRSPWRATD